MSDSNADQIAYWTESGGPIWVALQALLDRQLAPFGEEVNRVLAPRPGQRVLDIGCGCGATTLRLADCVGPGGAVLGVDISAPMLTVARQAASGSRGVSFRQADAQSADLGTHEFDAMVSRFGIMFFANPVAAFSNIRKAIKPGGRIGFVCWRALRDNPWMSAPLDASLPFLPPMPPGDPWAPGPFALADHDRLQAILRDAGFSGIEIARFDTLIGGNSLEDTLRLTTGMGPLGKALREHPQARPKATEAVQRVLESYQTPQGIRLPASTWVVTGCHLQSALSC